MFESKKGVEKNKFLCCVFKLYLYLFTARVAPETDGDIETSCVSSHFVPMRA